jgi:organic hydroperoxide reductase OsmC/OhrA
MVHVYNTKIKWVEGRKGELMTGNGHKCEFSAPPEFKGESGFLTGEDALVASVNIGIMLTFLSLAEREKIEIKGYESDANGILGSRKGNECIIRIVVHPKITIVKDEDIEEVERLLDMARKYAITTNSVRGTIVMEHKIEIYSGE